MAYTKFNPDKKDVIEVATKYNGNIVAMAAHYNIARSTMYEYLYRDSEGKAIVNYVRNYCTETDLDQIGYVTRYNMGNYKQDARLAQMAANKFMDKIGHKRGWGTEEAPTEYSNQQNLDLTHENMRLKNELEEMKRKFEQRRENADESKAR